MTSPLATFSPSVDEIRGAVTDELTALGGSVSHAVADGECLFLRAVLPANAEIRVGDSVQAGVAVHAMASGIAVYPYTFRQVCANGAIAANALPGQNIERLHAIDIGAPSYDATVIVARLREAVRRCASPEAFSVVTHDMRAIANLEGSHALQMLHVMTRMPRSMVRSFLPHILRRFAAGEDRSAFGVMNAVTSIARDTANPSLRWSLEEIGGSLPARLVRRPRVTRDAIVPADAASEVLV